MVPLSVGCSQHSSMSGYACSNASVCCTGHFVQSGLTSRSSAPARSPASEISPGLAAMTLTSRGDTPLPAGRFDVYVEPWRTPNIDDQVSFLTKHLTPTAVESVEHP